MVVVGVGGRGARLLGNNLIEASIAYWNQACQYLQPTHYYWFSSHGSLGIEPTKTLKG